MMQDKAIRTFGKLSIGMIVGMIAACAGGDTPVRPDGLDEAISNGYGLGSAATGSGGTSSGGTGGRAPTPPSNGGTSASGAGGTAGAGRGGSASTGEAGAAGSAAGSAGMDPVPTGDCDGFGILKASCGSSGCHGAGSSVGNFAETLEDAKSFVGEDASSSCSGRGPLFDPDNAAASIVVQKIEGTINCGGRMPLTGAYLDADQVDCVKEWIGTL
jgi:hypothetical protein